MNPATVPPPATRWQRVRQKTLLRTRLAWQCLTTFEDTVERSCLQVSYAQNGEDLIAWHALHSLGITRPRYLDIGAHHPVRLSNTALFYLLGCRGINIEPDPALFGEFPRRRPADINLNVGIGREEGEFTFFRMADPTLNTFVAAAAERLQREEGIAIASRVPVRIANLNTILAQRNFTPDFMTLDTEGQDLLILESFDFTRHRPAVICVETLTFSTQLQGRKMPAIVDCLLRVGYKVHADTRINTLFIDAQRLPPAGSAAQPQHPLP